MKRTAPLLLDTLPVEAREVLLAYQELLQESGTPDERLKNEIRIFIQLRALAEDGTITEPEAETLTNYFLPEWATAAAPKRKRKATPPRSLDELLAMMQDDLLPE